MLEEGFNKGEHKQDYVLPNELAIKIFAALNVNPIIDVCATKENTKCIKFITPEQDFFQTEIYEDAYMNSPYLAGNLENGVRGIGNFVARLYNQHIYHNITTVTLLPSTATSNPWFHTYYGPRLVNAFGESADPYFIEGRVKFKTGKNSSPPFSSQVFVHRRKSELELQVIRQRYNENKEKVMW